MSGKIGKLYPVTMGFKDTAEFPGLHRLRDVEEKCLGTKIEIMSPKENKLVEVPKYIPYIELTTQSIVIIEVPVDPTKYLYDFMKYVNALTIYKEVLPQLFDAGYIPYIIMPHVIPGNALKPDNIISALSNAAANVGAKLVQQTGKFFADSSTTASYYTYWVSRKDAAKILNSKTGSNIDLNDNSALDKITTLQLFEAVWGGIGNGTE